MQPTFQQQTLRELYSIPETTPPPVDNGMTNKQVMIYVGITIGAVAIGCIILTMCINSRHNAMLIELQRMQRDNQQQITKCIEGHLDVETGVQSETKEETA